MFPNLFIQFIAIIAVLAFAISFQAKTRQKILTWQIISMVFWLMHYSLLNAATAVVLILLNLIFTVIVSFKDQKPWINNYYFLTASIAIFTLSAILNWEHFYSIFALMGVLTITIAKWQNETKKIKTIAILASISWIIYDYFVKSSGGIIAESFIILSIIISLIREPKNKLN